MTVLKDEQRLRLDIGRTTDFLAWQSAADSSTIVTMGADFFTWTSLRQADDFHFPVDAVDYLFGIVFNAKHRVDEASTIAARLRISHISAHLVDGSYDKKAMAWRNGQLPRVYSREFFDLIGAWEWEKTTRIYAGGQYVYHIDPSILGRYSIEAGAEARIPIPSAAWLHPYAAYDFRLDHNGVWTSNHSVQAGVKLGEWQGRGINIFASWFSGTSEHGEYYDARWTSWGYGFTVDL